MGVAREKRVLAVEKKAAQHGIQTRRRQKKVLFLGTLVFREDRFATSANLSDLPGRWGTSRLPHQPRKVADTAPSKQKEKSAVTTYGSSAFFVARAVMYPCKNSIDNPFAV